jgi:hypothetical protein
MMRSEALTHTLHVLSSAGLALLLVGCVDEPQGVTSPKGTQNSAAQADLSTGASSNSVALPPEADAQARFHSKNYADWVGQAHNKALDDFAALASAKWAPRDMCREIADFMSQPARVPPGKDQLTHDERRAYANAGLRVTPVCQNEVAKEGSDVLQLARAEAPPAFYAAYSNVSAAANSLLDQIKSAQAAATTAAGLASVLTGILTQADQLAVSSERDLVYATASVAQSSYEYWTANIATQSQQVQTNYGSCLAQYSTESAALSGCMGITAAPITPTDYLGPRNNGSSTFVAFMAATGCEAWLDKGAIGGYDFAGAVVGGLGGMLAGGPGILLGAITTGGVASATESWYQFGRWAYCKVKGGGTAPGVMPKTT